MLKTIEMRGPFHHAGGHLFVYKLDGVTEDDILFFQENGKQIGQPEHEGSYIQNKGAGRFTFWSGNLFFSSSDGSNCNTNRRKYSVAVLSRPAREHVVKYLEKDDEAALRIFAGNANYNNKVIPNFFRSFNLVLDFLARHSLSLPKSALEIGCGHVPYVGLRYLAEGGDRYIGNDIYPVQKSFGRSFIDALRDVCESVRPELGSRLRKISGSADPCIPIGFEARGETPVEELEIDSQVGLIFSTSALEHVMKPEAVAQKMAAVIEPRGLMIHSIDFRDHSNFEAPFTFYKVAEADYRPTGSENRLRPSDWIELLLSVGFELLDRQDCALTAESVAAGLTHANGGTEQFYRSGEIITPSFTAAERETFDERFRNKDLVDLSITCSQMLFRKI
jgi:hypothetical protein